MTAGSAAVGQAHAALDRIEKAREKATPGPWRVDPEWPADIQNPIADSGFYETHGEVENESDAACIVAEHNAVPKLVSAVRAVLDHHHPVSQNVYAAYPVKDPVDVCAIDNTTAYPCQTVRFLTAALTEAETNR